MRLSNGFVIDKEKTFGERRGRREGRNEGNLEKTKIVVRNLLQMGFSVDAICKAAECAPALVKEMQDLSG